MRNTPPPLQTKSVSYTSNGTYTLLPDAGKVLSQVTIGVYVPDPPPPTPVAGSQTYHWYWATNYAPGVQTLSVTAGQIYVLHATATYITAVQCQSFYVTNSTVLRRVNQAFVGTGNVGYTGIIFIPNSNSIQAGSSTAMQAGEIQIY